MVQLLKIVAGPFTFKARLEEERAPKTAAAIRAMLPFKSKLVHCRWSGESTWVPMGETKVGGSAGLAYDPRLTPRSQAGPRHPSILYLLPDRRQAGAARGPRH